MESVDSVWQDYRDTGSSDAKTRLTLQYAPLVKWVANRGGEGTEDRIRLGLEGLQAAIDGYGAEVDGKFETYAMACISGALDDDPYSWDAPGWAEA